MFKQIAPNIWSIEPPPFPKELDVNSKTVLQLANIDFVYQGFDGNFHYFIHRYTNREEKPKENRHCFEEILVYRTHKSVLIGYTDSYYSNGLCNYHNFLCDVVKGGVGFCLFELQVKELQDLEKQISENQEIQLNSLVKPTSFATAMIHASKSNYIKKKFTRIGQFFRLANLDDFK